MKKKTFITLLVVFIAVIVALIGLAKVVVGPATANVPTTKAASGPDHYNYENFFNGIYSKYLTSGGDVVTVTATGTQSVYTLSQDELLRASVIKVGAANSPAVALTLPATSTLNLLIPNAGDSREYVIYNANTVAATTTTVTTGTGITLGSASTTAVVQIGKSAILKLVRRATTDVIALLILTN